MTDSPRLQVRCLGVRGSTPTPHADYLHYGGNTTCIEIRGPANERIVFDAGTGIRKLGAELAAEGPQLIHIFLTHFHWDHIHGLPFFLPLLTPGNTLHFHAFPDPAATRERLHHQMTNPYFTLDYDSVGADCDYSSVDSIFRLGALSVTSFPLNHPQGAVGYRVECKGAAVVIATDLEHGDAKLDRVLRQNAEGADLLIYDAQYTTEEYATRRGWGHSNYAEAARAAADARVSQLLLFHHDPTHDDGQMKAVVQSASTLFENVDAARELYTITL